MDLSATTLTDVPTVTVPGPRPSTLRVSEPTPTIRSPQSRPPRTLASAEDLVESTSSTLRRGSSSSLTAAPQQNTSRSTRSTSSTPRSTRSPSSTSRSSRSTSNTSPTSTPRQTRSSVWTTSNPSPTSINAVQSSTTVRSPAIAVPAEEIDEIITTDNSQTVDRTRSVSGQALTATTALPALVVGTITFTATINRGSTQFIVGTGNTLTPNGVVTLGETVVSLADNPTEPVAIIDGETATIAEVPVLRTPPPITVAEEIFTAIVTISSTFYSFAPALILTAGGVVTVNETRVSLAPDATEAVIGSNTVPLADPSDGFSGSSDVDDGDGDVDDDVDDVDDIDDIEEEEEEDDDDDDDDDNDNDNDISGDNGTFSAAIRKSDPSTSWLMVCTICTGIVVILIL